MANIFQGITLLSSPPMAAAGLLGPDLVTASIPATQSRKKTAKAAAEHKQEVSSLNLNFSLQA